jgi:predicted RNA-binding Zn ribbon-like protein
MLVTEGVQMISAASGLSGSDPLVGQAPGDLARLQAFVNTLDLEQGTDELATPAALDAWVRQAGLTGLLDGPLAGPLAAQRAENPGPADEPEPTQPQLSGRAGPAELALAVALREALRAVLRSHVTHRTDRATRAASPQDPAGPASAKLAEIAAGLGARMTADADGAVRVLPGDSGVRAALERLLLIAAEAATLGTWKRLKVCSADDCQWAFYDRSPTRSGCWCSMQVCGSRAKSRAYRTRQSRTS